MEVTKEVIEENLKRIEEGKPLTMPLVILNGELKKEYFRRNKTPEEIAKQKEYYQRPEVKAKQKEYYQKNRDKILAKLKKRREVSSHSSTH